MIYNKTGAIGLGVGDMQTQEKLDRLRQNEQALRERGVTHAAVFGSVARGENRHDSDIDIMVEIAPDASVGVYESVGIVHLIEDMFTSRVYVANRASLKAYVRTTAERNALYAF